MIMLALSIDQNERQIFQLKKVRRKRRVQIGERGMICIQFICMLELCLSSILFVVFFSDSKYLVIFQYRDTPPVFVLLSYDRWNPRIIVIGASLTICSQKTRARSLIVNQYKFTVVYWESVNFMGYITVCYLLIVNSYASVHIARNV